MRLPLASVVAATLASVTIGCALITSLDGLQSGPVSVTDGGADAAADGTPSDAIADVIDNGPTPVGDYLFAHHWPTNKRLLSTAALPGGGFLAAGHYDGSIFVGTYLMPNAPSGSGLLVSLDANGGLTGATAIGVDSGMTIDAVTAGASGVYVAGYSGSPFTFNGTSVLSGVFVAKLDGNDPKKAPLWVHLTTNLRRMCGSCLRATNDGVVGLFAGDGTFVLDGTHSYVSHGDADVALAKLGASNGAIVWANRWGGTNYDLPSALAVGATGTIHAAFVSAAPIQANEGLGATPPAMVGNYSSLFVATFEGSGKYAAARAFGDPAGSAPNATCLDVDGAGRVLVGGVFNGGVDFGKGVTGSKATDGFSFVQDAAGTTVWQQIYGDTGTDSVEGCAFDRWGHVAVVGSYGAAPTIGSTKLPPATLPALFVAKLSPSGTFDWVHGFAGRDGDGGTNAIAAQANHVAIGVDGTIAIGGGLLNGGGVDLGGGVLYGSTEPDAFIGGFKP